MEQNELQQARELIQAKRYDEARVLLKSINHPKAEEWLAKLDQIAPSSSTAHMLNTSAASPEPVRQPMMNYEASPVIQPDSEPVGTAWVGALIGGLVGALIGSAIWAGVAIVTDYETSLVAFGVGFLAGGGVIVLSGRKSGLSFQAIAAVMAVIGILVGKYLAFYHVLSQYLIGQYGQDVYNASGLGLFSSDVMADFMDFLPESFEAVDIVFFVVAVLVAFGMPSRNRAKDIAKKDNLAVS